MKKLLFALCTASVVFASLLSTGCKHGKGMVASDSALVAPDSMLPAVVSDMEAEGSEAPAAVAPEQTAVEMQRKLIWTASMAVEVKDLKAAVLRATELTEKNGGYVENKTERSNSAELRLRVPVAVFNPAVSGLESLGKLQHREISGEDVTEQYIDTEARLKNKMVLRDRLQQLLDRATNVQDVLSVENELNRVQSEIDSMEGRLRALKGMVSYATINLSLQQYYAPTPHRKKIYGPIGLLLKGLGWTIEKMFIIRE